MLHLTVLRQKCSSLSSRQLTFIAVAVVVAVAASVGITTSAQQSVAITFAAVSTSILLAWVAANSLHRSSVTLNTTSEAFLPQQLPAFCREIINGVVSGATHTDDVFRELMARRLSELAAQARLWSHSQLVFCDTESWRTAYEKVLSAPDISEYRSVAWLKSEHYWQDPPGRHGLRHNFDLLNRGVRIERVLILGWTLWPPELTFPRENVRRWIEDQHYRGVSVLLVRETDLIGEQALFRDFGIYGERAVGELHCDEDSRTVSFTLSFERAALHVANEHWERLKLYARPYAELLDQVPCDR